MKPCICCGTEKPLDDYYTHPQMGDGHLNKCKECVRAYARLRHHEKMDADPEWREAERRRGREKHRKGRDVGKAWATRSAPAHHRTAHSRVCSAVRVGRIVPSPFCERCGHNFSDYRREGHHPDYSIPMSVEWLCARCHRREHRSVA